MGAGSAGAFQEGVAHESHLASLRKSEKLCGCGLSYGVREAPSEVGRTRTLFGGREAGPVLKRSLSEHKGDNQEPAWGLLHRCRELRLGWGPPQRQEPRSTWDVPKVEAAPIQGWTG